MDIKEILEAVKSGEVDIDDALIELKKEPFTDIDFAKIDNHRLIRKGVGEVIYGEGKTPGQILEICKKMLKNGDERILVTRLSKDSYDFLKDELEIKYFEAGRIGIIGEFKKIDRKGKIVVVTAGTSDIPVAEEAIITAQFLGNDVVKLFDVGVAGIHRLFSHIDEILSARVVIVVAGMEGALPSVVGGLTDAPLIAVPTSVGYGTSFGGMTALLSMLNSCASGISVVNIDNGFGAGFLASMINKIGD